MLQSHWAYDTLKEIVDKAKQREADPETVMVDELMRYLENDAGVFSEFAQDGRVSLKEVDDDTQALSTFDTERPVRLREIVARANEMGLDLLDALDIEVQAGELPLREALGLALQFGKRIYRLADQYEAQQHLDMDANTCELKAIERELVSRHYRRL